LQTRLSIIFGSWTRIRIKVKIQKLYRLKTEPWMLTMEALKLKMVPGGQYLRPVVADSNHFDEEQDLDLDTH
jgi:hypothetical protein